MIPQATELGQVDDRSGELIVLVVAHEGVREGAAHGDDVVWSWHL